MDKIYLYLFLWIAVPMGAVIFGSMLAFSLAGVRTKRVPGTPLDVEAQPQAQPQVLFAPQIRGQNENDLVEVIELHLRRELRAAAAFAAVPSHKNLVANGSQS